ncbi:glycerol kinase, partial [Acrasis kona]
SVARTVNNTAGVYFVPAFSGLFAPHWRPDARGVIVGLTQYVTRAHVVRALLESICHQSVDVIDAMVNDTHIAVHSVHVDGGMSINSLIMQIQADLLGRNVIRPAFLETTVLGAAISAAIGVNVYNGVDEIPKCNGSENVTFEPEIDGPTRGKKKRRWDMAVQRSLAWHVDGDEEFE